MWWPDDVWRGSRIAAERGLTIAERGWAGLPCWVGRISCATHMPARSSTAERPLWFICAMPARVPLPRQAYSYVNDTSAMTRPRPWVMPLVSPWRRLLEKVVSLFILYTAWAVPMQARSPNTLEPTLPRPTWLMRMEWTHSSVAPHGVWPHLYFHIYARARPLRSRLASPELTRLSYSSRCEDRRW